MNELQVFGFEGRNVRVVEKDGNSWWVAKDVAEILDYEDAEHMTRRLDSDEICTFDPQIGGMANRSMIMINESGLYSAIIGSNKSEAKAFKKWITSEVLPSIRKTGSYGVTLNNPPTDARLREVNKAVRMGVLSAKEGKAVLLTPAAIPSARLSPVQKKVQTAVLPTIPSLDTFLSLPDFAGWRDKLDDNPGCFERMGVKLIRRGIREELAIDHNHKILLRAAGRDYKARLKTDPRYIETRQVYIAHEQVSALIFDWKAISSH